MGFANTIIDELSKVYVDRLSELGIETYPTSQVIQLPIIVHIRLLVEKVIDRKHLERFYVDVNINEDNSFDSEDKRLHGKCKLYDGRYLKTKGYWIHGQPCTKEEYREHQLITELAGLR